MESMGTVPGMVAAKNTHFRSIFTLNKEEGKFHMMLQEAETERQHLFTFLELRDPGNFMRFMI